jgi:hypothetical protein
LINAGIFHNATTINPEQIVTLEKQILNTNGMTGFYLDPKGKIVLVSSKPVSSELKDVAWHRLDYLFKLVDGTEMKYEYFRTSKNTWSLNLMYIRDTFETIWHPLTSDSTALLGKALLGKMILGRRY